MTAGRPLIIGVNVNENTGRAPNPHVPWTPAEIAQTAADSEAAGAALMHYHGRDRDGAADHSATTYGEIARQVRGKSSLLLAPSLANVPGYDASQRLSNLAPNQNDLATKADFVPVDAGCANMDLFDPERNDFASDSRVFVNDIASQRHLLSEAGRIGLKPYLASFNLSWTRSILAHIVAGRVAEPVALAIVLGGDEFPAAHPVTPAGIDAHLALLPASLRCEWIVSAYRGDVLAVADHAIKSGGHVAIGTGDYHYQRLGYPTTADLVARVAEIGLRHGRPPAGPERAQELFDGEGAQ